MALTSTLKTQVDLPVFEFLRQAPGNSSAISCTCTADNSLYHVNHGRYIYYLQATTGFYRYDTITDMFQQLASPPVAPGTWASMRFAGAKGYDGRVLSATNNTLQIALPNTACETYDIRITGGTGVGQRRIITDCTQPNIADVGSATTGTVISIVDSNKNWVFNQWVGYQVRIIAGAGAGQVRKILYNNATTLTISDNTKYPDIQDGLCYSAWGSPASGSIYQIESSVITVDSNWGINPDATSRFTIDSGGIFLFSHQATSLLSVCYYDILADTWYVKTANSIITSTGTDGAIERTTENASVWDRGTATGGSDLTLVDNSKSWTTNQFVDYYVRIFSGTGEGVLKKITSNTSNTLTWVGSTTAPDATSKYTISGFEAGICSEASVKCSDSAVSCTGSILSNVLTVTDVASGALIPGMVLTGTGINAVRLFTNATSSAAVVTVGSTTNVQVGMVMTMLSGTGTLAAGITTVIAVNSSTTFTISQTPSVALSSTNAFVLGGGIGGNTLYTSTTGSGSGTTITIASTSNLVVGMAPVVTAGTGTFADGTIVTAVNSATTFTVSVAPSVGLSGATVYAVFPSSTVLGAQLTGTPGSTGTYKIYPPQTVSSTTIVGNGVALLVDSTKSTWPVNRWNNLSVRITAGTGKGQVRVIQQTIPGYLSVKPDWTTALDNTSTYEIHGNVDCLLLALGANSSLYQDTIPIDLLTTNRVEEYGCAMGASAQYADHPPTAISTATYSNPTMTVTTVAAHNFKTGMTIVHKGDAGANKAQNNISAAITVTGATTYTYSVGAGSANMTIPAQATNLLVDGSKSWIPNMWAGHIVTYIAASPTANTGVVSSTYSELIIGNSATTLYFARTSTAPVQGVSRYVISPHFASPLGAAIGTLDAGIAVGTQSTTALADGLKYFSSVASSCSSSGTTITTTGNLKGLMVGMYVSISGGGGSIKTPTKVATLISDTQFTVDVAPAAALSSSSITGTFWPYNLLNGRRARIVAGAGAFQEWALTSSNANNVGMTAITTAPITGSSVYVILPLPTRGAGVEMTWLSGISDTTKRGSYIIIPRAGGSAQIDRLNLQTDTFDTVNTIPQTELFSTGTNWAYDWQDRIYIMVNGSLRLLYLDINTFILHGAGQLPYIIGTPVIGNRMEIFRTPDNLKYLWVNRQTGTECFRGLLFY